MKKFASIFVSVLLVALMVFGTVAQAASVLPETPTTASLTLYKFKADPSRAPITDPTADSLKDQGVKDAVYTAYKIASLNADGTFTLEAAFADLEVSGKKLSSLFTTDKLANNTGSLTYTDTDEFEKYIPILRQTIERGSFTGSAGTTGADGKAVISDLALGVYLVLETTIPDNYAETSKPFLVQLPQWDQDAKSGAGDWLYNVTAYPKNDPVDLTKKIVESNNAEVDETTRAIGDVIDYRIEVDVPYYGDLTDEQKAKIKYFLTDTMSEGLTFNNDVTVKVKSNSTPLTKGTNFTVSTSDTTVIKVDFTPATVYTYGGDKFVIEYSATLNEKAVDHIGSANTNVAKVTFTTNPRTGKADPDTDDTDEDDTKVYTYGFDLTKKFNNGTDTPNASTVEFSLKSGDTKLQFVKVGDNYLVVGDDWADYVEGGKLKLPIDAEADAQTEYTVTTALNPTSTGLLSIRGLKDGTYTLTEEKTHKDYSLLESDITIVVTAEKTAGKLNGTVSAKAQGTTLTANQNGKVGIFEISINNVSKQFTLPQTGGAGLLAFTIGGGIVIAGAIILFSLLRKKRSAE